MKNTVNQYVKKFTHARQVRRRFLSIVLILALVVSLCVFWQLRSDGVAMANETFCGMEEHTHGEECYEQVLTCGLEESDEPDGHTHTDACYESVLTCDIPEHIHTVDCLIDETADVEEAADWEATLPDDLTDNWADNVVAIAESQIGYTESEANFRLAEDNETRQGYTRYGAWYGNEYGDWDAMFASFCLSYAGVPESEFPQNAGAYAWTLALTEMESADETGETVLLADAEDYIPAPGDLVFFDRVEEDDAISMDDAVDHVGIVEAVETETVEGDTEDIPDEEIIQKLTVIEGNSNDAVERIVYDYTSEEPADIEAAATIAGYAILPGQTEVDVPEAEVAEEAAQEDGMQTLADDAADASEPAETAWTGGTSGKVVLNLGNGNGKYNFADYTGSKTAGTLLRYTTDSLADYADDDGSVTIHLPSDRELNDTFTVVDAMNGLGAVTVALGDATAFDYELVGWVNIATGEYYDVSGGATTATVDLDNENVFYADWIAATYDLGSSTDADLRTDTVSTADFVTMHMYDFNELFNLYSESLVQNGTTSEAWTDSGNLYNSLPYGTGQRFTNSFLFVNDGTTNQTPGTTGGMLTWPAGKTIGNTWTGSGELPLDATETWGILSPESPPMNMLYDRTSGLAGVHYVGDADYLFWLDDDGYYTYNSKDAAATYNQGEERFYVYDRPLYVVGTEFSCFLPFNEFAETTKGTNKNNNVSPYSVSDGTVDYWFGMDMEVDFYLPNATGTRDSNGDYGNQVGGKDMVFTFSGDDDILIFIDDVLVLDMSGIHDESFGSINFADGNVTMGMSTDSEGNIIGGTTTGIKNANGGTGLSAGNHELQIYYMERGGYASNLEIQFNVVPLWEYQTGEVQTVTAEKTWVDAQGNVIDPSKLPDAYQTNGVEVGLFDVLPEADLDDGVIGYTRDGTRYTFSYEDDAGLSHTFVYDSSVPSLTYTEGDEDSIVFDQVDSEGRVLDTNGHVVCWLEEDTGLLHMRMDVQELNSENGWYYAWKLLDADGTYEVLELSESSSYTTSSEREDLSTYEYWSVIGDYEIEHEGMLDGLHPVLLTEAAQEAGNTLGDTKEAMGYVIVGNEGSIATEQIKFSQIATLEEVYDENNIVKSYLGTYGVTSQSEVATLGEGALWYMVDSTYLREGVEGEFVESFYLHCELGEPKTNYYLTLTSDEHGLALTTQEEYESEFYYDSLGELMVITSSGAVRVEIMANGTINIDSAETVAAVDDVRIYALRDTKTGGFSFTAYNIFLPDITLQKVDIVTESTLTGVSFSLQDDDSGLYYAGVDPETDEVIWSEEATPISTDADGKIRFQYMADGIYILTEEEPLDGYAALPSAIQIIVEDGVIGSVSWSGERTDPPIENYVTVSEDGLALTIANTTGAELPQTGGIGTWPYVLVGVLLVGGAGYLLLRRRRETF